MRRLTAAARSSPIVRRAWFTQALAGAVQLSFLGEEREASDGRGDLLGGISQGRDRLG